MVPEAFGPDTNPGDRHARRFALGTPLSYGCGSSACDRGSTHCRWVSWTATATTTRTPLSGTGPSARSSDHTWRNGLDIQIVRLVFLRHRRPVEPMARVHGGARLLNRLRQLGVGRGGTPTFTTSILRTAPSSHRPATTKRNSTKFWTGGRSKSTSGGQVTGERRGGAQCGG